MGAGTWILAAILMLLGQARAANIIAVDEYRSKPVLKWSPADVEAWMNHTLGLPEYSLVVRRHAVDGPTLMALQHDDLVDSFGLLHPLHLVKLRAHLALIKSQCLCATAVSDFWSYLGAHHNTVYVLGSAAMFTPRLAMFYAYFFDYPLLRQLIAPKIVREDDLNMFLQPIAMSSNSDDQSATDDADTLTAQIPIFSLIIFVISAVFCPRLWMAFQTLGLFSSNWIVAFALLVFLVFYQLNEIVVLACLAEDVYKGEESLRRILGAPLKFYVRSFNVFFLAPPVITLVTSYFLPFFVQDLLIYVFFLFCGFTIFGLGQLTVDFLRGVVRWKRGGPAPEGAHPKAD